jgi:hypothetical protein
MAIEPIPAALKVLVCGENTSALARNGREPL